MKKIFILLISTILALNIQAQVGISKVGAAVKFTGLTKDNTQLTVTGGILYQLNINQVVVSGRTIYFGSGTDGDLVHIRFSEITNKFGTANPTAYTEYLIANGYFSSAGTVSISGTPTITAITDPVVIDTVNTPVQIKGISESVLIDTIQTSVQVKGITEDVSIDTIKSSVQIKGITQSVVIDTINKPVRLQSGTEVSGIDQDKTAFTLGTSKGTTAFGIYSTDVISAGQKAALSITAKRELNVYHDNAYDSLWDAFKTVEQTPPWSNYKTEELLNTTNVTGTNYYPGESGGSLNGYSDLCVSGKIIEGNAVTDSLYVQVSNALIPVAADWMTVYAYDPMNNTTVKGWKQTNAGTLQFTGNFDNLNYLWYRIVVFTADATNTQVLRVRRKY